MSKFVSPAADAKNEACNQTFSIGIDLGQKHDPTAIVIVEKIPKVEGRIINQYLHVVHGERLPLGTPYPGVVEEIRKLTYHKLLAGRCRIAVDATGVGGPVVDLLRAAHLGCGVDAVTITGGGAEKHHGGDNWTVPRADLMSTVQIALEQKTLKIAKNFRDAQAIYRELLTVRTTAGGGTAHDDLVLAMALACWRASRRTPMNTFGTQRLI